MIFHNIDLGTKLLDSRHTTFKFEAASTGIDNLKRTDQILIRFDDMYLQN